MLFFYIKSILIEKSYFCFHQWRANINLILNLKRERGQKRAIQIGKDYIDDIVDLRRILLFDNLNN